MHRARERVERGILISELFTAKENLLSDMDHAIKCMKSTKATGPDDFSVEALKRLGKTFDTSSLNYSIMSTTGEIPEERKCSTLKPLPKTNNVTYCTSYQTISLISRSLKIFIKIIIDRLKQGIYQQISNVQYGFIPDSNMKCVPCLEGCTSKINSSAAERPALLHPPPKNLPPYPRHYTHTR